MKGYKVFNPDWTCRNFQYEVGKTYEMEESPSLCEKGFHFCEKAADCFEYYAFDSLNHVAEVEAIEEISKSDDDSKCCTNKIKIIRELSWHEVLALVNTGNSCTGIHNSGSHNSGNYNSGHYNSGSFNSGNQNSRNYNSGRCNSGSHNSGHYNSGYHNGGYYNSGNYNSGNQNSGDRNSGYYNSGNYNSGDWNKSDHNSGCFMTIEPKIMMFNKPTDWTYEDWRKSGAKGIMDDIPTNTLGWIPVEKMTDTEKEEHPECKTTGGYLKKVDNSGAAQEWWDELPENAKNKILSLPNFDKEIFYECTGIKVEDH